MALKPVIYKFNIALSDLDRDYYDALNLTLAQHPSETVERMMVRVLAYCINAQEGLGFTKGLCAVDEPDIWVRTLDDQLLLWVDVGEPAVERIKKATHLARHVKVYTFNSKSDVWWKQEKEKFGKLSASVYQFSWNSIQELAGLIQRTMSFSVTITDQTLYLATEGGECTISWKSLEALANRR